MSEVSLALVAAGGPVLGKIVEMSAQESMREKVHRAEALMLEHPQVEIPVRHFFAGGVYGREMFVKKGTILTGKIHKYPQINVLSSGEVSVLLDDGVQRVKAPFTVVAPAGSKRIFYAHEDSVWTVFHGTEETDVEKIEAHFIAQTEAEYLGFVEAKKLEAQKCLG